VSVHRNPFAIPVVGLIAIGLVACTAEASSPPTTSGGTTVPTGSATPTTLSGPGSASAPTPSSAPAAEDELQPVSDENPVVNDSFVSPLVERYGDISIGRESFVAGNTTLRADPDRAVCIGSQSNIQDNVLLLALQTEPHDHEAGECGQLSASSGNETSIAHQAVITNSTLGDFVFVGYHAQIRDSVVEDGASSCTAPSSRA